MLDCVSGRTERVVGLGLGIHLILVQLLLVGGSSRVDLQGKDVCHIPLVGDRPALPALCAILYLTSASHPLKLCCLTYIPSVADMISPQGRLKWFSSCPYVCRWRVETCLVSRRCCAQGSGRSAQLCDSRGSELTWYVNAAAVGGMLLPPRRAAAPCSVRLMMSRRYWKYSTASCSAEGSHSDHAKLPCAMQNFQDKD